MNDRAESNLHESRNSGARNLSNHLRKGIHIKSVMALGGGIMA